MLGMALALPAHADRGSAAYKKGMRAERQANLDAACGFYGQAHTLSPRNPKYFIAFTQTRFKAGNEHVHNGQLLRNTGELEKALMEFQQAVGIDPSNFLGHQGLRQTEDLLRRREEERSAPKTESPLARFDMEPAEPVELQPVSSEPMAFRMTGDAESVYKALCKMAGLNVFFDDDFRAPTVKLDLARVTLLQALEVLRMQSKSAWRPVAPNTIFVTAEAVVKGKELDKKGHRDGFIERLPVGQQDTAAQVPVRPGQQRSPGR